MSGFICHVNELESLPNAVYIGRRANRFHLDESLFCNPFKVTELGREETIRSYITYLIRQPALLQRLPELRGRGLACWCRRSDQDAPPCHGDVLLGILAHIPDPLLASLYPVVTSGVGTTDPAEASVVYLSKMQTGLYAVDMGALGEQIAQGLFPGVEMIGGRHG